MADSNLFTPADEKIVFTNLGDVITLTLDFIALLTPACGGDKVYDDSRTFVGEAFSQMVGCFRIKSNIFFRNYSCSVDTDDLWASIHIDIENQTCLFRVL